MTILIVYTLHTILTKLTKPRARIVRKTVRVNGPINTEQSNQDSNAGHLVNTTHMLRLLILFIIFSLTISIPHHVNKITSTTVQNRRIINWNTFTSLMLTETSWLETDGTRSKLGRFRQGVSWSSKALFSRGVFSSRGVGWELETDWCCCCKRNVSLVHQKRALQAC